MTAEGFVTQYWTEREDALLEICFEAGGKNLYCNFRFRNLYQNTELLWLMCLTECEEPCDLMGKVALFRIEDRLMAIEGLRRVRPQLDGSMPSV